MMLDIINQAIQERKLGEYGGMNTDPSTGKMVQKKAEALCRKGYQAEALKLDVTDNISVTEAFSADPYDVVINNAGISGSGRAVDMQVEEFESVLVRITKFLQFPTFAARTAASPRSASGTAPPASP